MEQAWLWPPGRRGRRKLVGFSGVTVSSDFDGLNLSYHLHPESWGHGNATELVGEALRAAFGPLHAERVIGLARPANPASRRVLEKCGFIFERDVTLHGAPTMLFAISSTMLGQRDGQPC